MGQSPLSGDMYCCVEKRLDFSMEDWLADNKELNLRLGAGRPTLPNAQHLAMSVPSCACEDPSPMWQFGDADLPKEVAWEVAADRRQQIHEAASVLSLQYDVRPSGFDQAPHTATAVHKKTQVVRKLASFQKPQGAVARERFTSYIESLKHLSSTSESMAKVLEVYDDHMHAHLIMENCTGGTVYERILDRQSFTEQECAVLVRHMLQALIPLHDQHLFHGSLTPESFCFLSDSPHSTLKLVDFGIELKVHRWDAVEHVSGGPDIQNPQCPQLFEICKLAFCAPELAPPHQVKRKAPRGGSVQIPMAADVADWHNNCAWRIGDGQAQSSEDILDEELLADVIDEHSDWIIEQQQDCSCDYSQKFEAADIWSLGAIAFVLLCGYPPFFAPSRNTILGRIHRGEFSFDPPFWSKISEEAKSFVSSCLQQSCWDRPSLRQALEHPWLQRLADSSPSGSMFASFMLNLRRFYRTSLIELYAANLLATKFRREDMHDFLRRCREIDISNTGFFTASDLKNVLNALGHSSVSEAIASKFIRAYRHPGESYIDYVALLDSIHLRQQRLFETELWRHFQRVCHNSCRGATEIEGRLDVSELAGLLGDPVIMGLFMREIPESAGVEEASVRQRIQFAIHEHCADRGIEEIEFRSFVALIDKLVRTYTVPKGLAGISAAVQLEALGTVSTVL